MENEWATYRKNAGHQQDRIQLPGKNIWVIIKRLRSA